MEPRRMARRGADRKPSRDGREMRCDFVREEGVEERIFEGFVEAMALLQFFSGSRRRQAVVQRIDLTGEVSEVFIGKELLEQVGESSECCTCYSCE